MTTLNHDYETFCELDIKKVGGAAYVRHPSLEILMMSYAFDDDPVKLWTPAEGEAMPPELRDALTDPHVTKRGFNVPFEMGVTKFGLGIETPAASYRCTQAEAYALSFAGSLGDVGKQIGIPEDKQKLEEGEKLIQRFCKPAPGNHKATRYDRLSDPDRWDRFKLYCLNDTEAERAIHHYIAPYEGMSEFEWLIWQIDRQINEAGLPVDLQLVAKAKAIHEETKRRHLRKLKELTGLANPNSGPQLMSWLRLRGIELPDLTAETLDVYKASDTTPEDVKEVLRLKRLVGMTAPKKWDKYQVQVCPDGALRGMFQYAGAGRTRRWASRGINLQNLKSPRFPGGDTQAGYETAVQALATGDADVVNMLYGDPIEFVGSMVRAGMTAPDGQQFAVCDLSSIESVAVGYIADCKWINDTFAKGLDTYKKLATRLYGVAYEDVTKKQRKFSKPVMLAGPYGQGAVGLVKYAASHGVELLEAEAKQHIDVFRSECWEIPQMWKWLNAAIEAAVLGGVHSKGYKLEIFVHGDFLFIRLPSGRRLAYHKPEMRQERAPWGKMVMTFTYMGMDQDTRKWRRLKAHGGLITENIIQAFARDILANGLYNAWKRGLTVVGHVHDEIMSLVESFIAQWGFETLRECMITPPPWAPDIRLDGAGYVSKHYRKD